MHMSAGTISLKQLKTCMELFTRAMAGVRGEDKSVGVGIPEVSYTIPEVSLWMYSPGSFHACFFHSF